MSVSRPMEKVVLNYWVTGAKPTPLRSNNSKSDRSVYSV